jgi:septum site-determining protein MinC
VTQASSRHINFRGTSFTALALEPEAPLAGWVDRLDAYLERSPAFFSRKAIVIDVSKLELERSGLVRLLEEFSTRRIRVLGVAGVDPAWASDDLPPVLTAGRPAAAVKEAIGDATAATSPDAKGALTPEKRADFERFANAIADSTDGQGRAETPGASSCEPIVSAPLIVDEPVRSGQTVFYPQGDVIIIGSVSSGADVIAGGSVHVYGTLRGRAMAGAYGDTRARIFCRRLQAELLAVGGVYLTAEEIDAKMLSQNVQVWLQGDEIKVTQLV